MAFSAFVLLATISVATGVLAGTCYFNEGCTYNLYSSKTPYDAVRGDIRDYAIPDSCSAVSIWSLNRHGNRNPGTSVTAAMLVMANLKAEIIESHFAGRGQLCAQDVENFQKWYWNETLEVSQSYLTGTGYEELYDIGKRLNEKYPHLVVDPNQDFYFRTTDEQRTITSSIAFVHGWTHNTNFNLSIDGPWVRDDIIRPYENCDRYQQEVKGGQTLEDQVNAYLTSEEYVNVIRNVQNRLGITTQLTAENIYTIYEMCAFFRSWEPNLRSPWCAAFTNDDLVVLEYREDIRHYYRNAHGSWVNVNLGKIPMKDLFERFNAVVEGNTTSKLVAYFTHDTMMDMVAAALGLFEDTPEVMQGNSRDPNRAFRASHVSCFSTNFLAVLNSCQESTGQAYRVQIFHNEKLTDLCPLEGCTWQEFRDRFQVFTTADLDFCSIVGRDESVTPVPDSASAVELASLICILGLVIAYLR